MSAPTWYEVERRTRHAQLTADYPRGARYTLGSFPGSREALERAHEWWHDVTVEGCDENLLLWGPPGRGKTGLAVALMRHALEHEDEHARLVNLRVFAQRRRLYAAGALPVDPLAELLEQQPLWLALDDVGTERKEFALETLALLVEWRYSERLPTVYTSNLAPAELARQLGEPEGERLVSRMIEDSLQVPVAGPPLRRPA